MNLFTRAMCIRLKKLRSELDLSQAEFAKKINLGQSTWAMIEVGKRELNDRHIQIICLTFNVNEKWLRSGSGNMFNTQVAEMDELASYCAEICMGKDKFIANAVMQYMRLNDTNKEFVKTFISSIVTPEEPD